MAKTLKYGKCANATANGAKGFLASIKKYCRRSSHGKQVGSQYDHGMGKGGNLVDFGKIYYQCTVKELLARLNK